MSSTEQLQPEQTKIRAFDPSRIPITAASKSLVAEVLERLAQVEKRQRARRGKDDENFRAVVAAMLCDLGHRAVEEPEGWLTVEMGKRELSPAKRRAPFMTEKFPDTVRLLASEAEGLVEMELGDQRSLGGRMTTVRAGPQLLARIEELGLCYQDFEQDPALCGTPVKLRGKKQLQTVAGKTLRKAPDLPLPDTEEVRRIVRQMNQINRWLAEAPLFWLEEDGLANVDLGKRYLHRVFNNGSLTEGGRLNGGFWQGLDKDTRLRQILIGGEPVASLDFGQSSLRQAYGRVGCQVPDGDLYTIPGFLGYRKECKAILNALLSADKVLKRFPADGRGRIPRSIAFARVYRAICERHAPLVPLFGTELGLHFMYQESEVLIRVLLRLQEAGVVALPIHDCVLVPASNAELAATAMKGAFLEVTGAEGVVDTEVSAKGDDRQGAPASTIGMNRSPSVLPIRGGRKAA